jgi:hypothetical protein
MSTGSRNNRRKPSCSLGSFTFGDVENNHVHVTTSFEITDDLSRFLRRKGLSITGIDTGCVKTSNTSFDVLVDAGTEPQIVYDLMATLNTWTGSLPHCNPALAVSSPLRRDIERFLGDG